MKTRLVNSLKFIGLLLSLGVVPIATYVAGQLALAVLALVAWELALPLAGLVLIAAVFQHKHNM